MKKSPKVKRYRSRKPELSPKDLSEIMKTEKEIRDKNPQLKTMRRKMKEGTWSDKDKEIEVQRQKEMKRQNIEELLLEIAEDTQPAKVDVIAPSETGVPDTELDISQ
tara:strand:- start:11399 stop:11719 length:321 start_codon:yes stop_codon:yes gene_type:complete